MLRSGDDHAPFKVKKPQQSKGDCCLVESGTKPLRKEQCKMPNQVSNERLAGCLGSILPQSILTIAVLRQEAVITLVR